MEFYEVLKTRRSIRSYKPDAVPENILKNLAEAVNLLRNIPEIGIVELSGKDIVRHELVQQIVEAYEKTHVSDSASGKDEQ